MFLLAFLTVLAGSGEAYAQNGEMEAPLMSVPAGQTPPPAGCPPGGEKKASNPIAALLPLAQSLPKEQQPQPPEEVLEGIPVIQETNLIIVGGQIVSLWGISALAPDQQCWQDDAAWGCGQQATLFLRHFVGSGPLSCSIKEKPENAPLLVTCYRMHETIKEDIAAALVRLGWALSNPKIQNAPYAEEEAKAKAEKRGVWGSRFQTAEDWEEGVQRFMGEAEDE